MSTKARITPSSNHQMADGCRGEDWQWLSLTLAAPVVAWGAWPFHKATWTNLRHGAATMDTLISLGVGAAFLWSLYALFLGSAGHPGMRDSFTLTAGAMNGSHTARVGNTWTGNSA